MMLHFNRMQEDKDQERLISEGLREQRREATYELGKEVLMLSTKGYGGEKNFAPPELLDAESQLSKLTNEL